MLAAEREERSVIPQNIDVARADGDRGFYGAKGGLNVPQHPLRDRHVPQGLRIPAVGC